jgi:hypothetical protein
MGRAIPDTAPRHQIFCRQASTGNPQAGNKPGKHIIEAWEAFVLPLNYTRLQHELYGLLNYAVSRL